MAEEETQDKPEQLKRYRVRLDGNRGETVMKLTEKDAEEMGDRVLEDLGDAKMYGMPEGETKHADQTASQQSAEEEEEGTPQQKARTAANKKKSADNK